jgi:hypothetical protein
VGGLCLMQDFFHFAPGTKRCKSSHVQRVHLSTCHLQTRLAPSRVRRCPSFPPPHRQRALRTTGPVAPGLIFPVACVFNGSKLHFKRNGGKYYLADIDAHAQGGQKGRSAACETGPC